jgi:hypothetical protein
MLEKFWQRYDSPEGNTPLIHTPQQKDVLVPELPKLMDAEVNKFSPDLVPLTVAVAKNTQLLAAVNV